MKLREMMLDVARALGGVREGVATAGTTNSLTDATYLTESADFYTGGTLWLLNGANNGLCEVVKAHREGKLDLYVTLVQAIAGGDRYAVAPPQYPKHLLKQAILFNLTGTSLVLTDESLTTTANQEEYSLPAGVTDVRRVEVARRTSAPYDYARNYHWTEINGKLVFDQRRYPRLGGYKMRLWYVGYHSSIDESGDINAAVNLEWLKWASIVYAYRNLIETIHKDNPTAFDLLNEAKQNEAAALAQLKKHSMRTLPRDPHMASQWSA